MLKYKDIYEKTLRKVTPETFGAMKMESPKVHKYYPSFTVPMSDIPEAKKWKVGSSYKLVVEVVQTAVRMDENRQDITFEVKKIKAL